MIFLSHSEHSLTIYELGVYFQGPTCILGYYKFDQSFSKIYDSKTLTVCASLDEVLITEEVIGKARNTKNSNAASHLKKCKPFELAAM